MTKAHPGTLPWFANVGQSQFGATKIAESRSSEARTVGTLFDRRADQRRCDPRPLRAAQQPRPREAPTGARSLGGDVGSLADRRATRQDDGPCPEGLCLVLDGALLLDDSSSDGAIDPLAGCHAIRSPRNGRLESGHFWSVLMPRFKELRRRLVLSR